MQVLDEQISPPRSVAEQGADLFEGDWIDLPPFGMQPRAPPSSPGMDRPRGVLRLGSCFDGSPGVHYFGTPFWWPADVEGFDASYTSHVSRLAARSRGCKVGDAPALPPVARDGLSPCRSSPGKRSRSGKNRRESGGDPRRGRGGKIAGSRMALPNLVPAKIAGSRVLSRRFRLISALLVAKPGFSGVGNPDP